MSPEKARVFVVEDSETWQEIIRIKSEEAGHKVVLSASTLEQALEKVKKLKKLKVQVATIDGNLTNDISGADGQAVLAAIKTHAPEVKTIGMAVFNVEGVNINLGKSDVSKLGEVIKKL